MTSSKSLYPDILFHFTTDQALFDILRDTFLISYAREKIVGKHKSTQFAVPMVSFCDLKLSELKDHMDKYGNYGIGLTKEWANKKGLNPVFYTNKSSQFTTDFIKAVEGISKSIEAIDDPSSQIVAQQNYMNILNTYRFMKNYEGDLNRRNGKTTRNYRFADEREWRYVPSITNDYFPFVPIEKIDTDEKKTRFNQSISHLHLEFCPDDIKYLIVESDADINRLIDHLESVKGRFDEATRRRLASRILTAEQINSDV